MPAPKVNIRPGVSVLSVLRYLNYEPWFALAEFVDNAVQSYVENKKKLHEAEGTTWQLRVSDSTFKPESSRNHLGAFTASREGRRR